MDTILKECRPNLDYIARLGHRRGKYFIELVAVAFTPRAGEKKRRYFTTRAAALEAWNEMEEAAEISGLFLERE